MDSEDDYDDMNAITFDDPDGAQGEIQIIVDDNEPISFELGDSSITLDDLNINSPGTYKVTVNFIPEEGDTLLLKNGTITVTRVYDRWDFDCEWYYDEYTITRNSTTVLEFETPVNGTLLLYTDGSQVKSKTFNDFASFNVTDFGITKSGNYKISCQFITQYGQAFNFTGVTIYVDFDQIRDDYVWVSSSLDILSHNDDVAEVEEYDEEGDYVVGTVTLYIDGNKYYTKQFTAADKKSYVGITVDDLNIYNNFALGTHLVKLVYNRNNTKEYVAQRNVKFYAEPDVDYKSRISVGEKQSIDVTFPKGTTGTVTLYNAVGGDEDELQKTTVFKTVNIVNGAASIPLDSLAKGDHKFILNISSSTYNDEKGVWIEVSENTPGITANVNPTELTVGGNVVVTFAANKSDSQVTIELDGKTYKTVALLTGSVSETITGLSVGQHKIRVSFNDGETFFAKTFLVTVKAKATPAKKTVKLAKKTVKLTFKKVKIKKSAKKLVLKATVKLNNKYKKGLKVVFKFNGKKYTAKTNKKGVAKLTIQKKVLKKLKKGKKVKVQASYGGKTVKYSIKVKK